MVAAGSTLGDLLAVAIERLAAAGVDSPAVDARRLARALLGADPHRAPAAVPDAASVAAFEAALRRRSAREPLQLVLGSVAFHDIEVDCRPGVFVPRPETEVLVELAVGAARGRAVPVRVVEPCTGSGAVALALAAARPGLAIVATDRSPLAVAAARANHDRLSAAGRLASPVEVVEGDLLDPVDARLAGAVDVLVANPPYLPDHELSDLPPEVGLHDPAMALVAGPDGHELVDRLLGLAPVWLAPGGTVLVELDARRAEEAAARAGALGLTEVRVHPDLTGRARFVSARRAAGATDDGAPA
jgi:release factor glutamine methyltransferase